MRYLFFGFREVTADNMSRDDQQLVPDKDESTEAWKVRLGYTRLIWALDNVSGYKRDEPESRFVRTRNKDKGTLSDSYIKLYAPPPSFAVVGLMSSRLSTDEYIFLMDERMKTIELQNLWVPAMLDGLGARLDHVQNKVEKILERLHDSPKRRKK